MVLWQLAIDDSFKQLQIAPSPEPAPVAHTHPLRRVALTAWKSARKGTVLDTKAAEATGQRQCLTLVARRVADAKELAVVADPLVRAVALVRD